MEVLPGLFLGNESDSRNADQYDMVINCTTDLPFHGCSTHQHKVRVPVKDVDDPRQQVLFVQHASTDTTFETVSNVLMAGRKVLVHCRAGQQRSAAFVAVILCRFGTCTTPDEAVDFIRNKKKDAFLGSVNFGDALDHLFQRTTL